MKRVTHFKPIQDGPFHGCSRMGRGGAKRPPPPKNLWHISCNNESWHSYTLPKEDPKNIWIAWHTPSVLLTPAFFHRKPRNFAIKIYICRLNINTYFLVLLTYFESVEISLINIVAILMMSAKAASLSILKIKVFWNKCYDFRIYGHDGTNQFLSCESNYMVMWPKFGNLSIIYMRERGVVLVLVEVQLIGTGSRDWL